MDNKILDKHYANILNQLNNIIPVSWDYIEMYYENIDNVMLANFYFNFNNKIYYSGNIYRDFNISEEIYIDKMDELILCCEKLHNEFKDKKWEAMYFSVDKNFKYNIEYKNKVDNSITMSEREILWSYTKLNIIPTNKYDRDFLEKYINIKIKK